jgi:C-terminal processing protease CtpA/Prc
LIIDLRKHIGGTFIPTVAGLSPILKSVSLFGLHSSFCEKNDKFWLNYKDKKFIFNSNLDLTSTQSNIPIAIIINQNTCSAGEFCAVCFKGKQNVQFFGTNTAGYLSFNDIFEINNDISILLTTKFVTDTYMHKYTDEYIKPDVFSISPLRDVKKWLNSL